MKKYLIKELLDNTGKYSDNIVLNSPIVNTSIEGIGNFVLSPFQAGLVSCIIHYYFGDKEKVKKIINQSFNIIIENKKSKKEDEKKQNPKKVSSFLLACQDEDFLDENYNLTTETRFIAKKIHQDENFMIGNSMGLIFEFFLLRHLKSEYTTNYDDFLNKSINKQTIKYITSILYVIYITEDGSQSKATIKSIFDNNTSEKIEDLYKKVTFPNNFFEKLISEDFEENLLFEFRYTNEPIDIIVKSSNRIIAMIDLKVSELDYQTNAEGKESEKYCNIISISTNKFAVEKQILTEIGDSDLENAKDFNIGILRLTYEFKNSEIDVSKSESIFNNYNNVHSVIMDDKSLSYKILNKKVGYVSSEKSPQGQYIVQNREENLDLSKENLEIAKERNRTNEIEIHADRIANFIFNKKIGGDVSNATHNYKLINKNIRENVIKTLHERIDEVKKNLMHVQNYNAIFNNLINFEKRKQTKQPIDESLDTSEYYFSLIEEDKLLPSEDRSSTLASISLLKHRNINYTYTSQTKKVRKAILKKIFDKKSEFEASDEDSKKSYDDLLQRLFEEENIKFNDEEKIDFVSDIDGWENYFINKKNYFPIAAIGNKTLTTIVKKIKQDEEYRNPFRFFAPYVNSNKTDRQVISDNLFNMKSEIENSGIDSHIHNYNKAMEYIRKIEEKKPVGDKIIAKWENSIISYTSPEHITKLSSSIIGNIKNNKYFNNTSLRAFKNQNKVTRKAIVDNLSAIKSEIENSGITIHIQNYNRVIKLIQKHESKIKPKKNSIDIKRWEAYLIAENNHINKNLLKEIYSYLFK